MTGERQGSEHGGRSDPGSPWSGGKLGGQDYYITPSGFEVKLCGKYYMGAFIIPLIKC
jgi:hypothetical protein